MRLSQAQIETIRKATHENFGTDATLDLHIDLVIKEPGKEKPICRLAKEQGIQL